MRRRYWDSMLCCRRFGWSEAVPSKPDPVTSVEHPVQVRSINIAPFACSVHQSTIRTRFFGGVRYRRLLHCSANLASALGSNPTVGGLRFSEGQLISDDVEETESHEDRRISSPNVASEPAELCDTDSTEHPSSTASPTVHADGAADSLLRD